VYVNLIVERPKMRKEGVSLLEVMHSALYTGPSGKEGGKKNVRRENREDTRFCITGAMLVLLPGRKKLSRSRLGNIGKKKGWSGRAECVSQGEAYVDAQPKEKEHLGASEKQ